MCIRDRQYGQGNARLERFAACIIGCGNAPANEGIYRLFVEFVRALAAKSLSLIHISPWEPSAVLHSAPM